MHIPSFFTTHKKINLYILVCIVLVSIYAIFSLLSPTKEQQESASAFHTTYQKTLINATTENEVKKLPLIKATRKINGTKTEYRFQSQSALRDNIIVTENGKVVFEKSITGSSKVSHPIVQVFLTTYGEPEQTLQGSKTYGEFETFYIYASQGFTLVANPFTGEVDEIHTYMPTTVATYLETWGTDYDPQVRQHYEEAENQE